jgi:ubiquinol-cytochrome c reductase iron-sulfur subunit
MSDEHQSTPSGDEHRTPVSVRSVSIDDPHMQPATRYPKRVEGIVAVAFILGTLAIAGFGAAYWLNAKPLFLAVTFGGGLFLLGFGLTAWGKYLMPRGPFVEERHVLRSTDEEREAMSAALVQRTTVGVLSRRLLLGLFGLGSALFGVVALFPLLRSLGPLPGDIFEKTDWKRGSLLVDIDGRPVHSDTLQVGGILTVFPQGYETNEQSISQDQVVIIRVSTENWTTEKGRETWGPRGYVAYSKMCTHLGCPVGLYEQQLQLLVCPCHQSMFNVLNGAVPQFGPAPRPLPQLPLYVDGSGYLRAQSGFDQAVGPGFWERTTT